MFAANNLFSEGYRGKNEKEETIVYDFPSKVIPAGIEPTASEPESKILSIKLRDLFVMAAKIEKYSSTFFKKWLLIPNQPSWHI